jgi:hypothetical protein
MTMKIIMLVNLLMLGFIFPFTLKGQDALFSIEHLEARKFPLASGGNSNQDPILFLEITFSRVAKVERVFIKAGSMEGLDNIYKAIWEVKVKGKRIGLVNDHQFIPVDEKKAGIRIPVSAKDLASVKVITVYGQDKNGSFTDKIHFRFKE